MSEFILRALGAGLLVASMAGCLGTVVVWRRMAYFGDALAHSSLLGVVLGLLIGMQPIFGVLISCMVFAVLLIRLKSTTNLRDDALLGVLAHGALALGLVIWGSMEHSNVDLYAWLFGDILAVTKTDLLYISLVTVIVLVSYKLIFQKLVLISVDEDIATAEGVQSDKILLAFVALIALFVSAAIQAVGILLTTAILIIPAATARLVAKSPAGMVQVSVLLGALAVCGGLLLSFTFDLVTGPAIIIVAVVAFFIASALRSLILAQKMQILDLFACAN